MFCSLNLLFSDVHFAVAVVVFFNPLIIFLHSQLEYYSGLLLKKYFLFLLDIWIYRYRGFTHTLSKRHYLVCCQVQTQQVLQNSHLFSLAVTTPSPLTTFFSSQLPGNFVLTCCKFCSRLRNVLFPTLIAACFENEENKKIIEQEVSCALLENYIEVRKGKCCCASTGTLLTRLCCQ